MGFFDAIIFGIVEGITEFFPISSTGHLLLTARLLGIAESNFVKTFQIAIQLGAIFAVVALYGRSLILNRKILSRVAVAFLPTAVLGFFLYKVIKNVFMGNAKLVLWSLFLGGLLLIIFELLYREGEKIEETLEDISYGQSFLIGVFQAIAVIPGVSRAAATIVGGLLLGLKRKTIVEFSFLLAIPTMAAATGYDLIKNAAVFSAGQLWLLLCGFLVSFFVATLSIRSLLYYIQRLNFIAFGVYRIVIAIIFLFI